MNYVQPKKYLGQHFLTDKNIAEKIVNSLSFENYSHVLEIGPGMGVLTDFLINQQKANLHVIEIDRESVAYLKEKYPALESNIISADFLKEDLKQYFTDTFAIIGNFPYNISSQIVFKIIENRDIVPESVGMFQKEVAERIVAKPGNKIYGILSVLTQAFYDIEYLFTVSEGVFNPPPKVKSAVIRMKRNNVSQLDCDEKLFFQVVKAGFNQRRKTLRNSLKSFGITTETDMLQKRAEQLSVKDFVYLTQLAEKEKGLI